MSRARPTVIVIYAPTKRAAYALRDALAKVASKLDLPGVGDTHWIGVGEDSADAPGPTRRRKATR